MYTDMQYSFPVMSRLRRIALTDRIFFVTTNLSKTVPFLRPAEMDLLLVILDAVRRETGFLLLGYVVMPDHAHLLFATLSDSVSHILHQWKFKSAHAIQHYRGHSGRFWQPRYFDFICRRELDVSDKLFYIHENPVIAKLSCNPEEWKWSSAAFYLRKNHSPIEPDQMDFSGDPQALLWPAPNRNS
jgi:putative transposase